MGQPADVGGCGPPITRCHGRGSHDSEWSTTALHEACESDNVDVLKRLRPASDDLAGLLERAASQCPREGSGPGRKLARRCLVDHGSRRSSGPSGSHGSASRPRRGGSLRDLSLT